MFNFEQPARVPPVILGLVAGKIAAACRVVMPGAGGFDLALRAESIRPDFCLLFMRYYDEEAAYKASSTRSHSIALRTRRASSRSRPSSLGPNRDANRSLIYELCKGLNGFADFVVGFSHYSMRGGLISSSLLEQVGLE
jgi:hypothetical protein